MATNYQRYLERKRQKQKNNAGKTETGYASWINEQFELAASGRFYECLVPESLFEKGMGNLVFSRSLPDGRMGLAMFLLDVFCLGVKNAFITIIERSTYDQRIGGFRDTEQLQPMDPTCFRKLVEDSAAYALDLGFSPHADYQQARKIFRDVDAAGCPTIFQFGHEGKPLYISGPNETEAQAKAIVEQLRRRKGEGNYHFIVGID